MDAQITYLTGFGNHFSSEAIADTLPIGKNSPQKVKHGLYAEQLSGTAFTAPRSDNQRSWLYRLQPSVVHGEPSLINQTLLISQPDPTIPTPPTQLRWQPLPWPQQPTDFIDGLVTMATTDKHNHGANVHHYAINQSMTNRYFYNADGELLFVPESGQLELATELGILIIEPGEIAVIPRGIKFQVRLLDSQARGYLCENYGAPLTLPNLGPIGSNGLANPRDFEIPVAAFENKTEQLKLIAKFQGHLWQIDMDHSPLDVVAWHGNYTPYKYNCALFNTINTVSFDHPDPSIFTVLTSQTNTPGVANVDFVIFPARWMVAEDTFRPPWYHRNVMSEYMGLIRGKYDAKENGFVPGGASLHNCMSPHGPDKTAFDAASNADLKPTYYENTLAFMFESCHVWHPSAFALQTDCRDKDYLHCWQGLTRSSDLTLPNR